METRRRGAPRASGDDAIAAKTPVPAEVPAEAAAMAQMPETERASGEQQSTIAAEAPVPTEAPAEVAAYAPAAGTEPTPERQVAGAGAPDEIARPARAAFAALAESQAALARGLTAMSDAMAGLTRAGFDIAAGIATDTLGVKTLSDAFRVNARFACRSLDSWLDGSAKLSGLGIRLADEASRPILRRLGQSWLGAARFDR
jgi:hypothetical protein